LPRERANRRRLETGEHVYRTRPVVHLVEPNTLLCTVCVTEVWLLYIVRTKLAGVTGNQVNERNPRKHKKRTSVPVVGEGSLEKVSVPPGRCDHPLNGLALMTSSMIELTIDHLALDTRLPGRIDFIVVFETSSS
jgi:hypothetical protein